jgi:hypothetical protein
MSLTVTLCPAVGIDLCAEDKEKAHVTQGQSSHEKAIECFGLGERYNVRFGKPRIRAGPPLRSAGRHQHDYFQEFKDSIYSDSKNAKGQEKEPHKRIGNKGQESQRPAKEKQDQPKKEFYHDCTYGRSRTRLQQRSRSLTSTLVQQDKSQTSNLISTSSTPSAKL